MKMTDKIHNTNLRTGYYRWLDWAKKNLVGGAKGPDEPYEWASIYYDRDIPYNMNGLTSDPRQTGSVVLTVLA